MPVPGWHGGARRRQGPEKTGKDKFYALDAPKVEGREGNIGNAQSVVFSDGWILAIGPATAPVGWSEVGPITLSGSDLALFKGSQQNNGRGVEFQATRIMRASLLAGRKADGRKTEHCSHSC